MFSWSPHLQIYTCPTYLIMDKKYNLSDVFMAPNLTVIKTFGRDCFKIKPLNLLHNFNLANRPLLYLRKYKNLQEINSEVFVNKHSIVQYGIHTGQDNIAKCCEHACRHRWLYLDGDNCQGLVPRATYYTGIF